MADDALFDAHAAEYTDTVQRAIAASGDPVQFFADLKVELMARAVGAMQPDRILDFGCAIGNTTRSLAARFEGATGHGVRHLPREHRHRAQNVGRARRSALRRGRR